MRLEMPADFPRTYPWSEENPKLGELTNEVLFDDVWERPGLSKRDRSLITVASLVARYRPAATPFHLSAALENGVTADELRELITHLAFYTGWPNATPVAQMLSELLVDSDA
jgi:4-carboxymuconolactone decarboxylase